MLGGLAASIGADAAAWTYFSPLGFQGGPFFQIARDVHQAAFGYGTEKSLARHRLVQPAFPEAAGVPIVGQIPRSLGQVIPGSQGMRDVFQMLNSNDPETLIRELLGYPEVKRK